MRALLIVGLLGLGVFAYVMVFTDVADPSLADEPVEEAQAIKIKKRAPEDWLATCLSDWDAQTHMTKTAWRTTCERVSTERAYLQLNTSSVLSVGVSVHGPRRRSLD
jgi:hypothetical protein